MTANNSIDPALFLSEHLERAEPELLRSMLGTFIDALMGAESDALAVLRPRAPTLHLFSSTHLRRNCYRLMGPAHLALEQSALTAKWNGKCVCESRTSHELYRFCPAAWRRDPDGRTAAVIAADHLPFHHVG
jgi:hypothetical protein